MSGNDAEQSRLIDRLSKTTLRLRNLFYFNLLLGAAVIFLVLQDPSFVLEKVPPAVATLDPVIKVEQAVKANDVISFNYQELFLKISRLAETAVQELNARSERMSEGEQAALEALQLPDGQEEIVDMLARYDRFGKDRQVIVKLFEADLASIGYRHLAGFAAFLIYADSLAEGLERVQKNVLKVDDAIPGDLTQRRELEALDLSLIDLRNFMEAVRYDSVLHNHLDDLPEGDELFRALVILDQFCRAGGGGTCSLADIRDRQASQAEDSTSKLAAPGLEVSLARDIVVPASPLVLLIAYHIYALQFRRRQALRQLLPGLSTFRLNLMDEAWALNSLVLNMTESEGAWRRVQSLLMAFFLFLVQAIPLAAVLIAGYYSTRQILLEAEIVQEFAGNIAWYTDMLSKAGVENLPELPAPPGLFWGYLWIAVAGLSALIMFGSLLQLLREQFLEIRDAWTSVERF